MFLLKQLNIFRTLSVSSIGFLLHSPSHISRVQAAYTTMPYNVIRNQGTITVTPRNEAKQSALVVILHGLGDTAEGFVDVAEVILILFVSTSLL